MIRARARGFTLIEVLLSIMLLALLVSGAYACIRTATRATAAGQKEIERTEKLRMAQQFLRRQLSQTLAMPYGERTDANGQKPMFEGSRDELTFVSSMPGYLGHGGAYVQRLTIERGRKGYQLTFRHAIANGYKDDDLDDRDNKPVVLIENIRQARFEYRTIDDQGRLKEWEDRWDRPAQMPILVRITLEFERGDRMAWPELIVPLVVDPSAVGAALEPSFFSG